MLVKFIFDWEKLLQIARTIHQKFDRSANLRKNLLYYKTTLIFIYCKKKESLPNKVSRVEQFV